MAETWISAVLKPHQILAARETKQVEQVNSAAQDEVITVATAVLLNSSGNALRYSAGLWAGWSEF
jgi:hypothetical protein